MLRVSLNNHPPREIADCPIFCPAHCPPTGIYPSVYTCAVCMFSCPPLFVSISGRSVCSINPYTLTCTYVSNYPPSYLSTHPVPRSRMLELCRHSPTCLYGTLFYFIMKYREESTFFTVCLSACLVTTYPAFILRSSPLKSNFNK
jgi:hypothetical protein